MAGEHVNEWLGSGNFKSNELLEGEKEREREPGGSKEEEEQMIHDAEYSIGGAQEEEEEVNGIISTA